MAEKTFKEWLDAHHTGIANAIRTKEGSTEKIEPEDFEQRILDLPSGGEVVNAQEKEVKLEYINQSFFPDSGYNYLSKLKINSILTSLETFTTDKFASIIKQGESILGIEGNYTGIDGISLDTSSVNVDFSELPKSYLDIANLVPNSNKFVRFDDTNSNANISYAGKNANIDFTGATGTILLENTGSLVFSGGGLDSSKIADGETILGVLGNFKGEGTTVVESIPGVKVGTASIDIDFAETDQGIVNANITNADSYSNIHVAGEGYTLTSNIVGGTVYANGNMSTYYINDSGTSSVDNPISITIGANNPTIDLKNSKGTVTINENSPELINTNKYVVENLEPHNIANGVWILGKQGTFKGTSFVTQDKEVESITSLPFTIYPDAAEGGSLPNVLTSVTIRGVSPSIDPGIKAENIKYGETILGIDGTCVADAGVNIEGTEVNVVNTIYKVYFNDSLSYSEVNSILNKLGLSEDNDSYYVAKSSSTSADENSIQIVKGGDGYAIRIVDAGNTIVAYSYINGEGPGFRFNKYLFSSPAGFQSNTNIGLKNYLISKVISVEPYRTYKDLTVFEVPELKTIEQTLYTDSNKVCNTVVVPAVTSAIDSNIQSQNIAKDVYILGVKGELETARGVSTDDRNALTVNNTDGAYQGIDINGQISGTTITIDGTGATVNNDVNDSTIKVNGSGNTINIIDTDVLNARVQADSSTLTLELVDSTVDFSDCQSEIIIEDTFANDHNFVADNLIASNIKSDVTILGVTGTYSGTPGVTVEGSSITVDNSYDTINLNKDVNATYNVAARYGTMNLDLYKTTLNITTDGYEDDNTIAIVFNNHTIQLKYSNGELVDILKDGTSIL